MIGSSGCVLIGRGEGGAGREGLGAARGAGLLTKLSTVSSFSICELKTVSESFVVLSVTQGAGWEGRLSESETNTDRVTMKRSW